MTDCALTRLAFRRIAGEGIAGDSADDILSSVIGGPAVLRCMLYFMRGKGRAPIQNWLCKTNPGWGWGGNLGFSSSTSPLTRDETLFVKLTTPFNNFIDPKSTLRLPLDEGPCTVACLSTGTTAEILALFAKPEKLALCTLDRSGCDEFD
jgi:hypothetical protein